MHAQVRCPHYVIKVCVCVMLQEKDEVNSLNKYSHNFFGLYCTCSRPYPDPDDQVRHTPERHLTIHQVCPPVLHVCSGSFIKSVCLGWFVSRWRMRWFSVWCVRTGYTAGWVQQQYTWHTCQLWCHSCDVTVLTPRFQYKSWRFSFSLYLM